jgi:hypothetical protein
MNMMAVQRVDPGLCDILSTVPQVVLYQYESNSNTWERTSIEGTLFIYSRTSAPSRGFVLLNRLSSDNLQEMVHPGSEYRVQGQFVLFKKHSDADKVYGLCFSTSLLSSTNGYLLTSLSSQAGTSNGTGHRSAPLTVGMRSQSVPSFPQSQGGGSSLLGERVDPMELLETAGNSYLNQAFSDETGSSGQDSPPSEGISFNAHPLTSSLPNDRGHPINVDKTPSSSSVHHHRGASEKYIKRSTPRTIPKLVNMRTTPPSAAVTNPPSSSSSRPPSHLVQSEVQYSSRAAKNSVSKQTPTSRHTSSSSSSETQSTAQQMTPRGEPTTRSLLRSSTAPGHMGRRKLHVPPPTRGIAGSTRGPSSSLLQEVIPEQQQQPLARQLFESPSTTTQTTRERSSTSSTTTAESSKTSAAHLETLFSQSLPASFTLNTTSDKALPTQPMMSLAEVEKQMKDEAASSPQRAPSSFAMFPLPPYLANPSLSSQLTSSQSSQPQSPSSQPSRNSNIVTTDPLPLSSSSPPVDTTTGEGHHVLLQPSSFSTATPPSRAKTTPLITHTATGRDTTQLATFHTATSTTSVTQRASTTNLVQLNIEPPSPIVSSSQALQARRGLLANGVFPGVPPLMHSAGMRAPPVSSGSGSENNSSKTGRGNRGKGGDGRGRRGRRSPGKSGSPVGAGTGESPCPQPEVTSSGAASMGVVRTPPSRSWSVPGYMNPELSVSVPSQTAKQPHTLLSPQQFFLSEETPPLSHTPPPPEPLGPPLSREQFKQALLFLIQNDEDFVSRIHHAYNLSVSRQPQ